jgi:hypothetical protein
MGEQPPPVPKAIELRIEDISQLFHTLDPFPFREKDLDKDVEEFIVSWARELSEHEPLKIVVHLPKAQASRPEARELDAAFRRYFDYRAQATSRDLRERFRIGRRALAIGLAVLASGSSTQSLSETVGRTCGAKAIRRLRHAVDRMRPLNRTVAESRNRRTHPTSGNEEHIDCALTSINTTGAPNG